MRQVFDGLLDEGCGPEDRRVDVDVLEPAPECIQRGLDGARDLQRIAPRLFLDNEQQTGPVIDDGIANRRREAFADFGHVSETQWDTVTEGDHRTGEIFRLLDWRPVSHGQALVRRVHEAARTHNGRVARRPDDRVEGDVVRSQHLRVDQHLELPVALSPDRHVRHAWNGHQARAYRPLGQDRHVHLRQLLRRQADLQHTAGGRQR